MPTVTDVVPRPATDGGSETVQAKDFDAVAPLLSVTVTVTEG